MGKPENLSTGAGFQPSTVRRISCKTDLAHQQEGLVQHESPDREAPKNDHDLGVSKNRGTPKSSILIGFSFVNHPFWGTTIFGSTHFSNLSRIHQKFFSLRIILDLKSLVEAGDPKEPCEKTESKSLFFGGSNRWFLGFTSFLWKLTHPTQISKLELSWYSFRGHDNHFQPKLHALWKGKSRQN